VVLCQAMSEWREWDLPPDRHRASRRSARVHVTPGASNRPPQKRPLWDRIISAYGRVMIEAIKIIVGALAGVVVAAALWLLVAIIRL
jgi:hypothetical protein